MRGFIAVLICVPYSAVYIAVWLLMRVVGIVYPPAWMAAKFAFDRHDAWMNKQFPLY